MSVDLLTVSTKGQIVIPSRIREQLGVTSGTKLAAYCAGSVIMLKPVEIPSEEDFMTWLDEAQQWAAEVGYSQSDVADLIDDVRSRKNVSS